MRQSSPEERLRETLEALARSVEPSPTAYRRALARWRHLDYRRRLAAAVIAGVIIVFADVLALWALNRVSSTDQMIFDRPVPVGAPAAPRGDSPFSV